MGSLLGAIREVVEREDVTFEANGEEGGRAEGRLCRRGKLMNRSNSIKRR